MVGGKSGGVREAVRGESEERLQPALGLRRIRDSISGDLDDVAASEENGLPFPQAGVVLINNFIDDAEEAAMAKTHVFLAIQVWTDGGDAHPESNAVFRLRGIQGGGVN